RQRVYERVVFCTQPAPRSNQFGLECRHGGIAATECEVSNTQKNPREAFERNSRHACYCNTRARAFSRASALPWRNPTLGTCNTRPSFIYSRRHKAAQNETSPEG